jgi:hypothetical protein
MRSVRESNMQSVMLAILGSLVALCSASPAEAACGCDKPPPPRAAVRPFVGYPDQTIALFDQRLAPGQQYTVLFESSDGTTDWSRGRAVMKRDLADGALRPQLRVPVGTVPLGPCAISVWSGGKPLYGLADDQFTVAAPPIVLHDFSETVEQDGYRAGVGRDGTLYIPIDVSQVVDATTFTGVGVGFPLSFDSQNVTVFNNQGFLMMMLDPNIPGLFKIQRGDGSGSDVLGYWRHEFQTYRRDHRQRDARRTEDGEWHADGTYHVDNDHLVVAIAGTLLGGDAPAPGTTPAFRLVVKSENTPVSPF